MDRDKRLTGHKRGQQVREQTISSLPVVQHTLVLRRSHMHQMTSKRTAFGTQRGPYDVVATLSFLCIAIDCAPSHPARKYRRQAHQLSISVLNHSHTLATRSSSSARRVTLSSTKPYRCPCNLATSTASRSFTFSSALSETAKEHDRMMPCFDRISADWKANEMEDWGAHGRKDLPLLPRGTRIQPCT